MKGMSVVERMRVQASYHASHTCYCARRVTSIEADRAENSREGREAFMTSLRHEVLRQAKEKGVTLPPVPVPDGGQSIESPCKAGR